MRRLLLILLLIPSLAMAQKGVKLVFEGPGSRIVWTSSSPEDMPPSGAPTVDGAETTLDKVDAFVCILDKDTGNMAAQQASKILGTWKVVQKDFSRIGALKVRLDQGGKPAEYASRLVGDQSKVVDPRSKGEATFYGVPAGKVQVVASYKNGEKDESAKQTFELALDRKEPIPTLILALTGAAAPAGKADSATKEPAKEASSSGGGGSLVGSLILILLVGGGALAFLFFGLKWIYANQDKTKDAIGKLGIQVPDPIQPDPSPVAPPMPIAQAPMAPIMLPDAGVTAPPMAAPSTGTPRLVGTAGTFELLDGVHVVGREAGLTVPLPNESTVSRRHAEIVRNGDSIIVRDTGSTNGTFVNGMRLSGDQTLRVGDTVQFGSVQFRVEG